MVKNLKDIVSCGTELIKRDCKNLKEAIARGIRREIRLTKGHVKDLKWQYNTGGLKDLIKYDLRACNSYRNDFYIKCLMVGLLVSYVYVPIKGCNLFIEYDKEQQERAKSCIALTQAYLNEIAGKDKILDLKETLTFLESANYSGAIRDTERLNIEWKELAYTSEEDRRDNMGTYVISVGEPKRELFTYNGKDLEKAMRTYRLKQKKYNL
jgi:hypothetical protein